MIHAPRESVPYGHIEAAVSEAFGVSRKHIRSRQIIASTALARHVLFALLREYTDLTVIAIGRIYHRDHSTVSHAVRRVAKLESEDAGFRFRLAELRQTIQSGMKPTLVMEAVERMVFADYHLQNGIFARAIGGRHVPRWILFTILVDQGGFSMAEISRRYGVLRAAVRKGVQQVRSWEASDPDVELQILAMRVAVDVWIATRTPSAPARARPRAFGIPSAVLA